MRVEVNGTGLNGSAELNHGNGNRAFLFLLLVQQKQRMDDMNVNHIYSNFIPMQLLLLNRRVQLFNQTLF